jgi:hypothetical protein
MAAVLAQAVREGRILATDALRVIKHEMRRRNTNQKHKLPYRSARAQAVIDDYASRGELPPKNGSDDALHADHVYELDEVDLRTTRTPQEWVNLLSRARTVVVVTARENYDLEALELRGIRGPAKYVNAGLSWADGLPPFMT